MRIFFFAVMLWLGVGVPRAVATDYEINLDRPVRVGQTFRVAASGWQREKSTITMDGDLVRDDRENYYLDFEAVVTVLATDAKGRITRESATVAKCDKIEAFDRRPLVAKGAVIVASVEDAEATFTIDGKGAGRELNAALELVLALSKGGASDDEIFGSRKRRHVGERWEINPAAAAGQVPAGNGMAQGRISGSSRLENVVTAGGTECLQISSEISIGGLLPELPEGIAVDSSLMQGTFLMKLPTDRRRVPVEETTVISFNLRARGKPVPGGPEMVLESSREYRVNQRTLSLVAQGG